MKTKTPKLNNPRRTLNCDKLTEEQRKAIDDFVNEVGGNSVALMRIADILIDRKQRKEKRSPLSLIHEKVRQQMALNATTKKTTTVKDSVTGNMIEVKYEQRAFTTKSVMTIAGCNQESAISFLKQYKQEIDTHHNDVLGVVEGTDYDADFFNRRVGRAAKRVEKLATEEQQI